MQYGIAFAPLVPALVLWIGLAAIIVIAAVLAFARARGAAVRVAALSLILLALANPSFTREDREPLSSVAAVVIDKSPSQTFGNRAKETEQVREALLDRLKQIKGLTSKTKSLLSCSMNFWSAILCRANNSASSLNKKMRFASY